MLGLHSYAQLSLVVESGGCSLVVVHRFLIVLTSLVVEHMLWACGLGSCSTWALSCDLQAPEHRFGRCGTWA